MSEEVTSDTYKQAMALVALVQDQERQIFRLASDKALVERRLFSCTESNGLVSKQRDLWMKKVWAVEKLHNADEPSCGDGCCFEDGDTCHHCDQPFPCPTIRAIRPDDD